LSACILSAVANWMCAPRCRYALPTLHWLGVVSDMLADVPAAAFKQLTPRDRSLLPVGVGWTGAGGHASTMMAAGRDDHATHPPELARGKEIGGLQRGCSAVSAGCFWQRSAAEPRACRARAQGLKQHMAALPGWVAELEEMEASGLKAGAWA